MSMLNKQNKPDFQYDLFEQDLYLYVCKHLKEYCAKKDIYALSIKFEPDNTQYIALVANTYSNYKSNKAESNEDAIYYKYCEEEWEIAEKVDALSEKMVTYYSTLEEWAMDDDLIFEDAINEHNKRIIDICINVLIAVRRSGESYINPELNFNVYVREYLTNEDAFLNYKRLNDGSSVQEYHQFLFGD